MNNFETGRSGEMELSPEERVTIERRIGRTIRRYEMQQDQVSIAMSRKGIRKTTRERLNNEYAEYGQKIAAAKEQLSEVQQGNVSAELRDLYGLGSETKADDLERKAEETQEAGETGGEDVAPISEQAAGGVIDDLNPGSADNADDMEKGGDASDESGEKGVVLKNIKIADFDKLQKYLTKEQLQELEEIDDITPITDAGERLKVIAGIIGDAQEKVRADEEAEFATAAVEKYLSPDEKRLLERLKEKEPSRSTKMQIEALTQYAVNRAKRAEEAVAESEGAETSPEEVNEDEVLRIQRQIINARAVAEQYQRQMNMIGKNHSDDPNYIKFEKLLNETTARINELQNKQQRSNGGNTVDDALIDRYKEQWTKVPGTVEHAREQQRLRAAEFRDKFKKEPRIKRALANIHQRVAAGLAAVLLAASMAGCSVKEASSLQAPVEPVTPVNMAVEVVAHEGADAREGDSSGKEILNEGESVFANGLRQDLTDFRSEEKTEGKYAFGTNHAEELEGDAEATVEMFVQSVKDSPAILVSFAKEYPDLLEECGVAKDIAPQDLLDMLYNSDDGGMLQQKLVRGIEKKLRDENTKLTFRRGDGKKYESDFAWEKEFYDEDGNRIKDTNGQDGWRQYWSDDSVILVTEDNVLVKIEAPIYDENGEIVGYVVTERKIDCHGQKVKVVEDQTVVLKPYEPTDPEPKDPKPIDPGTPKPIRPKPVKPGKPGPIDPNPEEPTDPGKPKPTDPEDPEPTDPGKPKPTDPGDPEPVDPVDPGKQELKPKSGEGEQKSVEPGEKATGTTWTQLGTEQIGTPTDTEPTGGVGDVGKDVTDEEAKKQLDEIVTTEGDKDLTEEEQQAAIKRQEETDTINTRPDENGQHEISTDEEALNEYLQSLLNEDQGSREQQAQDLREGMDQLGGETFENQEDRQAQQDLLNEAQAGLEQVVTDQAVNQTQNNIDQTVQQTQNEGTGGTSMENDLGVSF